MCPAVGNNFHFPRFSIGLPVRGLLSIHHPEEQLELRDELWPDQLNYGQLDFDNRLRRYQRLNQLPVQDLPELERLHLQQHLLGPDLWERLLSFLRSSRSLGRKPGLRRQLLIQHLLG